MFYTEKNPNMAEYYLSGLGDPLTFQQRLQLLQQNPAIALSTDGQTAAVPAGVDATPGAAAANAATTGQVAVSAPSDDEAAFIAQSQADYNAGIVPVTAVPAPAPAATPSGAASWLQSVSNLFSAPAASSTSSVLTPSINTITSGSQSMMTQMAQKGTAKLTAAQAKLAAKNAAMQRPVKAGLSTTEMLLGVGAVIAIGLVTMYAVTKKKG